VNRLGGEYTEAAMREAGIDNVDTIIRRPESTRRLIGTARVVACPGFKSFRCGDIFVLRVENRREFGETRRAARAGGSLRRRTLLREVDESAKIRHDSSSLMTCP